MTEFTEPKPHGRRVHFDPTITLGHIVSATVFLCAAGAAWATLDARVTQNSKEIIRIEADTKERGRIAELSLLERINGERARLDQTQVRTADDIREIKQIVRDGFRDLDQKLDRKVDKPGR